MFESLTGKFTQAFSALRSRGKITSADIDQVADQIYQALLQLLKLQKAVLQLFIVELQMTLTNYNKIENMHTTLLLD